MARGRTRLVLETAPDPLQRTDISVPIHQKTRVSMMTVRELLKWQKAVDWQVFNIQGRINFGRRMRGGEPVEDVQLVPVW